VSMEEGGTPLGEGTDETHRRRIAAGPGAYDDLLSTSRGGEGDDEWLLSYADVTTLLIVFLVLMFAFAKPNQTGNADAGDTGRGPTPAAASQTPAAEASPTAAAARPERHRVMDRLARLRGDREFGIRENSAGIEVNLSDRILFPVGQAELSPRGLHLLDRLLPVLKAGTFRVTVEGHTDDTPIATDRYPSNWELSSARASRVVRYLIAKGIDPKRLRAVGYADTRPIRAGDDPSARAANRRVSLHLSLPR
jgi:chemotaxis protein MotB